MTLSVRERPGSIALRGLEQFHIRGDTNGVGYCIAAAKPYALEFSNNADVICLLLGDINSSTKFEDDREKPLVFLSADPPRSIRASAMCGCAPPTCATALSRLATPTIFRTFWTIAASTRCAGAAAATIFATAPSSS